jgi:hypothetical protein
MLVCFPLLFLVALSSCDMPNSGGDVAPTATPIPPDGTIPVVVSGDNPLDDSVVVRVSNSSQVDGVDNEGLYIFSCDQNTQLKAAWAEEYEVAFGLCNAPNIQLTPLNVRDNANYSWTAASINCINCHYGQIPGQQDKANNTYNEIAEWSKSGHSRVFDGRYLETVYRGSNMRGDISPQTEWTIINNERVRVPPVINDKYRGPGFKLDFPELPGNCAYCHVPAAIPSSQVSVDLLPLFPKPADVRGEGVTCDVCHKVLSVSLDDQDFPFVDRPGVLSFKFLRPDGLPFMTGPFSNILTDPKNLSPSHRLTCSPVFGRSEFCAPCHYGKFGDMTIYNSYGEWRNSAYGDNPDEPDYMTCQDCHMSHMKPGGENPPPSRRKTCSESDPNLQNFDHNLMKVEPDESLGPEIPLMIRGAARVRVDLKYEPDQKDTLGVVVRVDNTKVGHKFPTDSPLRHLILVVNAKDQLGTALLQAEGDHIPNWGGEYGGLPGKIFANLLSEEDTNISPTVAYWNETRPAWDGADTRLVPGKTDRSEYYFSIPDSGEVKIKVTLIYRYAFYNLMVQKEWFNRPDIKVAEVVCEGPPKQPENIKCKDVELKGP